MTGVHSTTVSPSSVSTRRRTPCVLGCCGPMFSTISCVTNPSAPSTNCVFALVSRLVTIIFLLYSLLRARSLLPGLHDLAQAKRETDCPEQRHQRGHAAVQVVIRIRVKKEKRERHAPAAQRDQRGKECTLYLLHGRRARLRPDSL